MNPKAKGELTEALFIGKMKRFILLISLSFLLLSLTGIEYTGEATFYAKKFEGRKTATGEKFSNKKFTAASNIFDLGDSVIVKNLDNNNVVKLKINDRMHPAMANKGRIIDVSYIAAKTLNFTKKGKIKVSVKKL